MEIKESYSVTYQFYFSTVCIGVQFGLNVSIRFKVILESLCEL